MSALGSRYVIPFNRHYISHLITQILAGSGQRGLLLEFLMAYIIFTIPDLVPVTRTHGKGGETDLRIRNSASAGEPLKWFEDYFLIECKDRKDVVSEKEFGHFITKMLLNKTSQAAIVSRMGLSGAPKYAFASRDQQLAFAQLGLVILDIRLSDLQTLRSRDDFLLLLQKKYEKLRFG